MIKKIPREERPRERLYTHGVNALSLVELLAICLGSGNSQLSVLSLAENILSHFGTLSALSEASLEALKEVKGIGEVKAAQLQAIFALVKRFNHRSGGAKLPLKGPEDAYILIAPEIENEKKEVLALLFRNAQGEIYHHTIVSIGSLTEVIVHPREVFHEALHHRAFSLIVAHNHPSGNPTPSRADLELTRLLCHAGNLLGIRVDDHLIIGKDTFVSLWDRQVIRRKRY